MSKNLHLSSFFLLVVLLSFLGCSTTSTTTASTTSVYIQELTQEPKKKYADKLEQITNLWIGHFSNKVSIKNGTSDINIEQEIIGRRIWKKNRAGEYWIYVGWFQTDSYESALSSSVAQISRISADTAFITFYRLKEGVEVDKYEWQKDEPFGSLKPSDLESSGDGCGSYLVESKNGAYKAIANNPCYSPISEKLHYYKINAELKPTSIIFNTKFLDKKFNLVISYKDNTFLRFNKEELEKKYESFVQTN